MINKNKGFTLAELLIVISIIGILSTIIIVNISSARAKARDARRKSDLKTIQSAVEIYANANKGKYPQGDWNAMSQALISGEYASSVPTDPLPASNTSCDGEKCEYSYANTLCNGTTTEPQYHYSLRAKLERKNDSELKDCGQAGKVYALEN